MLEKMLSTVLKFRLQMTGETKQRKKKARRVPKSGNCRGALCDCVGVESSSSFYLQGTLRATYDGYVMFRDQC